MTRVVLGEGPGRRGRRLGPRDDLPAPMMPLFSLGICLEAGQSCAAPEAIAQGTVWADRVVVLPPPLDEHLSLEQRVKRFPFQQLVSKLPIVATDVIRHPRCGRPSRPLTARRPTGANSCRCTTTAMSFKSRPTSCPRSISTAFDPGRTLGHNKAVRRPDSERLRADARKTLLQRGKQAFREPVFGPARREHVAHESLISRPMLAEVPLAALSSCVQNRFDRHTCRLRGCAMRHESARRLERGSQSRIGSKHAHLAIVGTIVAKHPLSRTRFHHAFRPAALSAEPAQF